MTCYTMIIELLFKLIITLFLRNMIVYRVVYLQIPRSFRIYFSVFMTSVILWFRHCHNSIKVVLQEADILKMIHDVNIQWSYSN